MKIPSYKTFAAIPGFSNYEIDPTGMVRNITTSNVVKPKSDRPHQVQIKNDEGINKRIDFMEMANKVHGETKEKQPVTLDQVLASEKLTMQQKVYYFKTVATESNVTIAARFGYTKNQVHGLYWRMKENAKKIEEYTQAISSL